LDVAALVAAGEAAIAAAPLCPVVGTGVAF
jgi:hypothetical protein